VARYSTSFFGEGDQTVKTSNPEQYKPISAQVFQILLAVSDKQLHGYAIIRDINKRTGGRVTLTASTLYSAIKRMLSAGLVEESEERPVPELDDERRRYYGITQEGMQVLRCEAEWLELLTNSAREKQILKTRSP
jgi:DNA-binding PadR family transcriptional regulator